MRIETLTPNLHEAYDTYVGGAAGASIYHTRTWLDFLAKVFPVTSRTLVAIGDSGNIVGAMPLAERRRVMGRSLESLPFSHAVPPLGATEVSDALVAEARRRAVAQRLPLVLRGIAVGGGATASLAFVNTVLDLAPDATGLLKHIRDATQQQLRQALRNPKMSVRLATTPRDFAAMDAVMAENRRALASATHKAGFFADMSRALGGAVRPEICEADGRVVALFVSTVHGEQAIYHFGASLANAETRRLRPNNLLCWSALRHAVSAGATRFDFGTSLPSQDGLVRYKEGWGGVTAPLPITAYGAGGKPAASGLSQESAVARLAGQVIRRLPMPLYRVLTPPLIRELG